MLTYMERSFRAEAIFSLEKYPLRLDANAKAGPQKLVYSCREPLRGISARAVYLRQHDCNLDLAFVVIPANCPPRCSPL